MRRIFMVMLGLIAFSIQTHAQPEKSGVIQFESTFDPAALAAANGIKLSNEATARMPKSSLTTFDLLFNPAQASYKQGVEVGGGTTHSNQNGGVRYGGLGIFGGGTNKDYYYNFKDHQLMQAFNLNDTLFLMEEKLGVLPLTGAGVAHPAPVIEFVKSDEVKEILGFNCP